MYTFLLSEFVRLERIDGDSIYLSLS